LKYCNDISSPINIHVDNDIIFKCAYENNHLNVAEYLFEYDKIKK